MARMNLLVAEKNKATFSVASLKSLQVILPVFVPYRNGSRFCLVSLLPASVQYSLRVFPCRLSRLRHFSLCKVLCMLATKYPFMLTSPTRLARAQIDTRTICSKSGLFYILHTLVSKKLQISTYLVGNFLHDSSEYPTNTTIAIQ